MPRPKALPYEEYKGQRFGRLIVTGYSIRETPSGKWPMMHCVCDCGAERVVQLQKLKSAQTVSCGCHARHVAKTRVHERNRGSTTHGKTSSPVWNSWTSMKQRCLNPNATGYENYGGRGIKICDRWMAFENFLADMGERGRHQSIERINRDGDYEPSNCKWADKLEQADNTRATHHIIYKGEVINLSEAARRFGIGQSSIRMRLRKGWSVEQALETPKDTTQGARSKKNNRYVEYQGRQMILREACELAGVEDSHVRYYLAKGMGCDAAINAILSRRKSNA